MFTAVAKIVTRRPRLVLLLTLIALLGAGVLGLGAFGKLESGGFDDPASASSRAADLVDERFGGEPNLVLLVTARPDITGQTQTGQTQSGQTETGQAVDDPAVAAAGRELAADLAAQPGVTNVSSYWTDAPPLKSDDGRSALVIASVDEDHASDLVARYEDAYEAGRVPGGDTDSPVTVRPGGAATVGEDINGQVGADLAVAESIAIPITTVLMIIAFGGLVAALLPLGIGLMGILGGFAVLSVVGSLTDVSIFAVNLTTALGMGLGIDYALLMVSRFREELAAGRDRAEAVAVTVRTAGRTILFSGATVIVALAVMLVFPPYFLKSMAYAGIAVTAVAVFAAVVVLPAVLMLLGPKVNALRVGGLLGFLRRRRAAGTSQGVAGAVDATGGAGGAGAAAGSAPRETVESPFWRRVATVTMRRPLLAGLPVVALLLVLGAPFLHVEFGTPDDRVLRADNSSRAVGDVIRGDFSSNDAGAIVVVVTGAAEATGPDEIADYAVAISKMDGVARVDSAAGVLVDGRTVVPPGASTERYSAENASYLRVVPSVEPHSAQAQALVHQIRDLSAPAGTEALAGGPPAVLVDGKATIASHLPLAIGLIALTTFVLLFLFTGSVVLPLKAIVLNGLTLTAVFGVAVWIFQDGHLASLMDFTPGTLDTSMPVLLFCIAFGLSMDYEVFLLSRIKEEYDAGASNTEAVAAGLARTGRLVTTAAALLAVTFIAFSTSSVRFMQMFGLGTALAILLDASLIRGVLVPAFMRVAGQANWWAPKPLRALHARIGLSEAGPAGSTATVPSDRIPADRAPSGEEDVRTAQSSVGVPSP
ncbi:MMPL family transporter [Parafrankia sp. EUN1f]|uniref:MMPL family transporter n=1 Tax=Parafrankia sp. EUN1f TaxID=102897 RepID=UPI0001C45E04|nr:MMPL family transporter [Parafrankia sp. EUN1f]EFC83969.1 drug exporter of the RND superfamily-like protein [Parafrankia sp. EUN1f]